MRIEDAQKTIQAQQKELELQQHLHSNTESLVHVNSTQELLDIIFKKLSLVFSFDDIGLFEIREDGWHRDIAVDDFEYSTTANKMKKVGLTGYLPPDEALLASMDRVKITNFKELIEKYESHPHFPYLWEAGHREFISAPMQYAGNTFGVFMLWSKTEGNFKESDIPLFTKINELVSVTLANILSKRETQQERNFKEKLLTISNDIAHINNRNQLFKTMYDTIRTIFPFDTAGLFLIDDEQDVFYELLEEGALDEIQDEVANAELLGPFPYSGQHKEAMIYVKETTVFDIEKQSKIYPNPQWAIMKKHGLKEMIAGPLRFGNKKQGFFCFTSKTNNRFSKNDFPLFKAIGEQLAVALNNVLANEQVLEEKQKTENLLNITESIANINTGPELVHAIFDRLQKVFPFHEAGLFHLDWENNQERDLVVDYSYETNMAFDDLKAQGLYQWMPMHALSQFISEKGPMMMHTDDMYKQFDHTPFPNIKE